MRPALLAGSFIALMVALAAVWSHRFERIPGLPVIRLADLRSSAPVIPGIQWTGSGDATTIRISAATTGPPTAGRLAIPGIKAVQALHLRFRMQADQLIPGSELWEDGRFIIEWHPNDPSLAFDITPAGSIRLDSINSLDEFVIPAPNGPATPAVRLENLGRSGSFEIIDLEISAVRETRIWKIAKWPLIAGWLAWGFAFVRSWSRIQRLPATAASGIWLLMAVNFAVPGPWQNQRAMVSGFDLGQSSTSMVAASPAPRASHIKPGPIPSLAKLKDQGSLPLRIKGNIAKARPLLHILLFCVPTFVIAWLLGKKPALWLMIVLALCIEASQMAFGYGFDWIDVFDLITDTLGIALGLWLCGFLCHRHEVVRRFAHGSLHPK